jgi:hypothetical protein
VLFIHAIDGKKWRGISVTYRSRIAEADHKVVLLFLLSALVPFWVSHLLLGQFYTISIQDTEAYDGDIHSVVRIAFHEDAHRKLAARYWSFWLSQQANPKSARALDIGTWDPSFFFFLS